MAQTLNCATLGINNQLYRHNDPYVDSITNKTKELSSLFNLLQMCLLSTEVVNPSDEREQKSIYHDFYINKVSNFYEVIAITYQKSGDYHHYEVIFSEENPDVFEQICDIELEMYEKYPEAHFYFTTQLIENLDDEIKIVKQSRNIIYWQELIYADQD